MNIASDLVFNSMTALYLISTPLNKQFKTKRTPVTMQNTGSVILKVQEKQTDYQIFNTNMICGHIKPC